MDTRYKATIEEFPLLGNKLPSVFHNPEQLCPVVLLPSHQQSNTTQSPRVIERQRDIWVTHTILVKTMFVNVLRKRISLNITPITAYRMCLKFTLPGFYLRTQCFWSCGRKRYSMCELGHIIWPWTEPFEVWNSCSHASVSLEGLGQMSLQGAIYT